jgi:Mg/Co/Ni transporter MgtE
MRPSDRSDPVAQDWIVGIRISLLVSIFWWAVFGAWLAGVSWLKMLLGVAVLASLVYVVVWASIAVRWWRRL